MLTHPIEIAKVLKFWFEDTKPEQQFGKDPAFDQRVRERFLELHAKIHAGESKIWRDSPQGRLAEIIVLDQFSRNMFRGTPEAFASDALALDLAKKAVAAGDDQRLPIEQRNFIYMPYMHSESPEDHEAALKLFAQKGLEQALKFEVLHKKIIDQFGRYPHRNQILGRISTPEEIEFLKKENSSFLKVCGAWLLTSNRGRSSVLFQFQKLDFQLKSA